MDDQGFDGLVGQREGYHAEWSEYSKKEKNKKLDFALHGGQRPAVEGPRVYVVGVAYFALCSPPGARLLCRAYSTSRTDADALRVAA